MLPILLGHVPSTGTGPYVFASLELLFPLWVSLSYVLRSSEGLASS